MSALEKIASRLEPKGVEIEISSPQNGTIILQAPQCSDKGEISGVICNELRTTLGGRASIDALIKIPDGAGGFIGNYAPDVCWWSVSPTSAQRKHPLVDASICPTPNLWIEVAFPGADCTNAILKILRLIPLIGASCTFLLIVIPESTDAAALRNRVGLPPNHAAPAMPPVTSALFPTGPAGVLRAVSVVGSRPVSPVMALWPLNTPYGNGNWLSMTTNSNVTLGLHSAAGPVQITLEMNQILSVIM